MDRVEEFDHIRFLIKPDRDEAEWVGRISNDCQFFAAILTEIDPIGPMYEDRVFLVTFIWELDGAFREAIIEDMGIWLGHDIDELYQYFEMRLKFRGKIDIAPIKIAPFQIERYGVTLGFIYKQCEDDVHIRESIELHPGKNMCFSPPWDGKYVEC